MQQQNSNGIKIQILESNNIRILLNEDIYYNKLDIPLERDVWYSSVINISNKFKQLSLNIWKMNYDENNKQVQTTNLDMVYENILNDFSGLMLLSTEQLSIVSSRMHLTNIRVMKQTINIENQQKFLNQNVVKDANNIIIADNAKHRLKLQKIFRSVINNEIFLLFFYIMFN